jgi:hypothetical protein
MYISSPSFRIYTTCAQPPGCHIKGKRDVVWLAPFTSYQGGVNLFRYRGPVHIVHLPVNQAISVNIQVR